MEPKFEPTEFKKFEDLPENKKREFKPTQDGFVKKEAVEDKDKAEYMAHTENTIIDDQMDRAVRLAKEGVFASVAEAGKRAWKDYDDEQEWLRLENLGKGEQVSDAAERLTALFEREGFQRGDKVEVCLKDGSKYEGWFDDSGRGPKEAIIWSTDATAAVYSLGRGINQGQISFGIKDHLNFPVQAIETVSLIKERPYPTHAAS